TAGRGLFSLPSVCSVSISRGPLGWRDRMGAATEVRAMSEPSPPSILYVDDDEANRHAFAWLLQRAGFRTCEARTGADALRMAADRPDLIILDVSLPDIDGFEVCRRIKAHPATAAIPVLHMSGVFVRSEDRTQGLEGGADGYLTKPVEPQEVIATVR